MKILVWGARGWIGQMICRELESRKLTFIRAESRADDPVAVGAELDSVNPTHCMSLIGRTHGGGFSSID